MPHLNLEASSNLDVPPQRELFTQLHEVLTAEGIPLGNCKSRFVVRDRFHMADGDERHAFVHLDVKFVEGRRAEAIQRIGDGLLRVLQDRFVTTDLDVQVTVHITEMIREHYFKHPPGTIAP